jgi:DNA-binding MurR/RpiR family transcriptional regulator
MTSTKASLLTRIHAAKSLSASQRRIADQLLGNLDEAAFWGVEELAERSQSSVATAVRFAQKLGYSGFLELRQALVAQAKKAPRSGELLLQAPAGTAATLMEVARRDVQNIEHMVGHVNEDLLQGVVARFASARHLLLLGGGVSALMCHHLAYLLSQAGIPALEGNPADFPSQVVNLDERDVLVAIGFQPYSRETVDAAAFARHRGTPVVAFTDGLHSPLASLAEHTLCVPGKNLLYSHSLAAFSVLAHAIATALATQDREATLRRLREAERIAKPLFTAP